MKKRSFVFAGLLLLLVAVAIGCGLVFVNPQPATVALSLISAFGALLAGTATVTYQYPVQGATAPTKAQMLLLSLVIAQVHFGDTDTTAVITHNFQNTTQENATFFMPEPNIQISAPGTVVPLFSWAWTDSNTITITKASATGTNCTVEVYLHRIDTNER